MEQTRRGDTNRINTNQDRSAEALREERHESDVALQAERKTIDSAMLELSKPGSSAKSVNQSATVMLASLKARIHAQRDQFDRRRGVERRKTDAAIRADEQSLDGAMKLVTRQAGHVSPTAQHEAREVPERSSDFERAEAADAIILVLAQLEAIATSSNAIALEVLDSGDGGRILDLAASISISTDRILDVCGDLMDPKDNRGLYHEIGGSG